MLRHSFGERRSHFCYCNKPETNRDQEERKKLTSREGTDKRRVGFAEVFDYDPKNRVADKEQSGQKAIRLTPARTYEPQNREQNDSFKKSLVKLGRMARRKDGARRSPYVRLANRTDDCIGTGE